MKIIPALLVLLVSLASPAFAQSNDVALWLTSQRNEKGGSLTDSDTEEVRFDSGSGFGVSASHWFASERVSGELAVFRTNSSASIREGSTTLADLGDVELTPITAMMRVHLRRGIVDVHGGIGVAHVLVADLDSADVRETGLGPVEMDDETTWTLGAGVTVGITSRLALAVDARFIPLDLTGRLQGGDGESVSSSLDPLLLSAGLRLRF